MESKTLCNKCNQLFRNCIFKKHFNFCDGRGTRSQIEASKPKPKLENRTGREWNKGLTKENNASLRRVSEKMKERHKNNPYKHSEETLKLLKEKNADKGGLREGSGRGLKQWYESPIAGKVYLRSSYEFEYVKYLDSKGILWRANKEKFPYIFQNKTFHYYPDFYLVKENVYVEIKGFKTERDKAKWSQFPLPLKVLFQKDLEEILEFKLK